MIVANIVVLLATVISLFVFPILKKDEDKTESIIEKKKVVTISFTNNPTNPSKALPPIDFV